MVLEQPINDPPLHLHPKLQPKPNPLNPINVPPIPAPNPATLLTIHPILADQHPLKIVLKTAVPHRPSQPVNSEEPVDGDKEEFAGWVGEQAAVVFE